jgi:hypothetical protein
MLDFKIDEEKFNSIEVEAIKKEYSQGADGSYYLEVDGVVSKDKLKEFRDNNVRLQKQLEPFKDLDSETLADLRKAKKDLENAKLWDEGKVDEVVKDRTGNMRTEYETKLKERDDKLAAINHQLESVLIDGEVTKFAVDLGVRKTAVDDVLLRARTTFKLKDGKPTPFDSDGQVIYGKDGSNPMSPSEWLQGLNKSAPHLFEESNGGDTRNLGNRRQTTNNGNMSSLDKIKNGINH